jgi:hypothetical protein
MSSTIEIDVHSGSTRRATCSLFYDISLRRFEMDMEFYESRAPMTPMDISKPPDTAIAGRVSKKMGPPVKGIRYCSRRAIRGLGFCTISPLTRGILQGAKIKFRSQRSVKVGTFGDVYSY